MGVDTADGVAVAAAAAGATMPRAAARDTAAAIAAFPWAVIAMEGSELPGVVLLGSWDDGPVVRRTILTAATTTAMKS